MSDKSKTVTLVLCLLLIFGFGGIHRLYAGKILSGIVQFFTGGGFLIWQVIDLISILGGSFTDGEGRPIAA